MALGCIIGAFHYLRRKRLIDDLPTSKTQGVFIGLAELKGTAESEMPFTSYLAGASCVYYDWHIEEHWTRTVVETYHDSRGTHTRTRQESGWQKVASGGQSGPFYLKDDTGVIRIVPDGATINGNEVFDRTCNPNDALYFGKGPQQEIANSTHRRRFQETAILLHTMLYAVGQARERQDIVAPEIAYDKGASMFLISTRTEKQVTSGYNRWYWFWAILGLAVAIGGVAIQRLLGSSGLPGGWQPFAIAVGGFLIAFALGWIWVVYNSLINLHHMAERAWSQVDVELKRRNDLIPNLVQTIEGYTAHERGVQELTTGLRRQLEATPPGVAGPDFKGLAPSLRIVIERYPELKANELFNKLQKNLTDTEQRIALARGYFNDIATFYNTRLEIVPDRVVATMAKLRPQTLMSAADFERAPVKVQLAS